MSRMGFPVMPEGPMVFGNPPEVRRQLGEARLAVHFAGGQTKQRALEAIQW